MRLLDKYRSGIRGMHKSELETIQNLLSQGKMIRVQEESWTKNLSEGIYVNNDQKSDGDQLLSFDRRKQILAIVNREKSVTAEFLLEKFNVSRMTINRDLNKLENEGYLKKVHGGVVALSHGIVTSPRASQSFHQMTDEQRRIGKEASQRISNGDYVIIESGSTCLALVENMFEKNNLKIVTVSPVIAVRLAQIAEEYDRNFEIMLPGGVLNVYKHFLLGPMTYDFFQRTKVDIAFLSVTAIDLTEGITADDINETMISKLILETCGKRTIGLVCSKKFDKVSFHKVSELRSFEEIITDSGIDAESKAMYEKEGIAITVC
jgi:DeoR family transcriptional regulator, fructose operon transcriptional repressor